MRVETISDTRSRVTADEGKLLVMEGDPNGYSVIIYKTTLLYKVKEVTI